jgi:hypothetical protein
MRTTECKQMEQEHSVLPSELANTNSIPQFLSVYIIFLPHIKLNIYLFPYQFPPPTKKLMRLQNTVPKSSLCFKSVI